MEKKILVLLLVLVVAISACKTADNNNGEDIQAKAMDDSQETQTQTDSSDDIKSFFDTIGTNVEYKVKYDVKSFSEGETVSMIQTMALKGKNTKVEVESEGMKASTYLVDGKTYVCNDNAGDIMCFEYPSADMSSAERDSDLRANWEDYNLKPLPSRTIAGTKALCFSYTVEQADVIYCYSSTGIPLYIKATVAGQSSEMTALEFSKTVSDSEFRLPAQPQEIPGMQY